jgi:hypothetical protein
VPLEISTFSKSIEGQPMHILEAMKAELEAEMQFRHADEEL